MFFLPQCPKSEYNASAPVVQRKTAPSNRNALGLEDINLYTQIGFNAFSTSGC